jgi:NAD(P)-dependent dehydrogenase (short-subunit alcohol dehydrogenase family)
MNFRRHPMQTVVITGSTRGFGLCMVREFLTAGCRVTLSGRGEALDADLAADLAKFPNRVLYIPCDVRSHLDIENLWRKAADHWGKIDIWINNAGVNCPYLLCLETDPSFIDAVIDTNIKGMIYGSQVAAREMLRQGSGQIFNIEGLGSNGMIQDKTILYGTTKRALTYFTCGLARELAGSPVKAGFIAPGMMLTDFITKGPDGTESPVIHDKSFRFVFNTLGDRPETVARFMVPRILANTKNGAHLVWLNNFKAAMRMMTSPFRSRKLIG